MKINVDKVAPSENISLHVQAVWKVSTGSNEKLVKTLYSDGGSGLIFNLNGHFILDDTCFSTGIIALSNWKSAKKIEVHPNSNLLGIRFHPAGGVAMLDRKFSHSSFLHHEERDAIGLADITYQLNAMKDYSNQLFAIKRWLAIRLTLARTPPVHLLQALCFLRKCNNSMNLNENINKSVRQIERSFKHYVNMTPKEYQRLIRVRNTLTYLKNNGNKSLVDVALHFGFSDQSHMTKEFKRLAGTSPSLLKT